MATVQERDDDDTGVDFFDNLVLGEDAVATVSERTAGVALEPDELVFANLSLEESTRVPVQPEKLDLADLSTEDAGVMLEDRSDGEDPRRNADPGSSSAVADAVTGSSDSVFSEKALSDSNRIDGEGSGGTIVKEVQWSEFFTRSIEENSESESSCDFFGKISDSLGDEKMATMTCHNNILEAPEVPDFDSGCSYISGEIGQPTDEQHIYSNQNWETLYPGWRYDSHTGQWYQSDDFHSTSAALYNFHDGSKMEGTGILEQQSEVSYLQHSAQSVSETILETANVSAVSNWNEASQGAVKYPAHMVFDPQYPGWYYDTITQEWRSLESYVPPAGTESQTHSSHSDMVSRSPSTLYHGFNQIENCGTQVQGNKVRDLHESTGFCSYQNNWEPEKIAFSTGVDSGRDTYSSLRTSEGGFGNQINFRPVESASLYGQGNHAGGREVGGAGYQSFIPADHSYHFNQQNTEKCQQTHFSQDYYGSQKSATYSQQQHILVSTAVDTGRDTYSSLQNSEGRFGNQTNFSAVQTASLYGQGSHLGGKEVGGAGYQSFIPAENPYHFDQQKTEKCQQTHLAQDYCGGQKSASYSQQQLQSGISVYGHGSYTHAEEKSSAGRPAHALVSFGFGGKLIVMRSNSYGLSSTLGSQDAADGSVSVLNLAEIIADKTKSPGTKYGACGYVDALCRSSFPGPLVGGNVGSKELYKWIDERIANYEYANIDFRKGDLTRLLFAVLKISCQQYGKMRSPFGGDTSLQEMDSPEMAVTKLFASARRNYGQLTEYSAFTHCMHNLSSESRMLSAAVEVQTLLVSGRRKEALHCAQEGQLWGLALVLAAQLGEQFYVDTVKQMALHQFVPGSPLRTLCLLISGEPAHVFAADNPLKTDPQGPAIPSQQPVQMHSNCMLDAWEENLAIITANRTKDDELVIIHLGDCLWKERGEITAAHICYLVAEANFESYSDSARLCLVGADHLRYPRTYVSPDAIQMTELYEYSKLLGNSQYILQPFQPYKLIYAYMLAEMGKVSESLRYCHAILKTLRNPIRVPEVETWRSLISSLEERIRIHQQGGYSTNLAPGKLVGKLFTSIDKISRMIGAPPPVPSQNIGLANEYDSQPTISKVVTSQSSMAMSSLIPSASMEPISGWISDGSKVAMHNRSISEPDFARSPKQVDHSKDSGSGGMPSFTNAPSRFGRFGSQLLQKTMGWVSRSRPDHQAKLGERNKFYYDEKLKRWVEEGAEPPSDDTALAPPPTTAAFQNGTPDYNINCALKGHNLPVNDMSESTSPTHCSGIPPIPPSSNQFSARGRMGVRSRYVDTFNKAVVTPTNLFQSPVPLAKTVGNTKFFVPAQQSLNGKFSESILGAPKHDGPSTSGIEELHSVSPLSSIQRFPSMDHITPVGSRNTISAESNNNSVHSHTRAASWSGSYTDMVKEDPSNTEIKSNADALDMWKHSIHSSFSPGIPNGPSLQINGSLTTEDYQDVDL